AAGGGGYPGVLKQYDAERARCDFSRRLACIDLRVEVSLLGVLCCLQPPPLPVPPKLCSPSRAVSAPASIVPSISSSVRLSSSVRPSTCATRSCTTATWSAICARRALSSSTHSTKPPKASSEERRVG